MKIAVIGAGFTGLSAAYELLKKGHDVTLFEKDKNPGGLALGFSEPKWEWTLEKHYHHWFSNDKKVLNLAKEISYPVLKVRPKTSVYVNDSLYQLDSPKNVITFSELNISQRLRMAGTLAFLKYNPFWKPLEHFETSKVLPKLMGKKAYALLWEPQLYNKFGEYIHTISLAWFWARIKKRTSSLCYPQGGFLSFANALSKEIKNKGGIIIFNAAVLKIKSGETETSVTWQKENTRPEESRRGKQKIEKFDKIIVTLPSFYFIKIAPDLPKAYIKKLRNLKGLGAMNLVMRLKKPFLTDGTYWLSVCERKGKISAIVEHTNFMDKKYYGNEHLVYLGNYLPHTHRYFSMTSEQILKEFDPFLLKINPEYKQTLITSHLFLAPFAQPIIPKNYSKDIPSFSTPLKNVFLANIQQVYPWDRGTNYAVELGQKVADLILHS